MSEELKRQAAIAALDEIRSGMVVGLGTGSTAAHFIRELSGRVRKGQGDTLGPGHGQRPTLRTRCCLPI